MLIQLFAKVDLVADLGFSWFWLGGPAGAFIEVAQRLMFNQLYRVLHRLGTIVFAYSVATLFNELYCLLYVVEFG